MNSIRSEKESVACSFSRYEALWISSVYLQSNRMGAGSTSVILACSKNVRAILVLLSELLFVTSSSSIRIGMAYIHLYRAPVPSIYAVWVYQRHGDVLLLIHLLEVADSGNRNFNHTWCSRPDPFASVRNNGYLLSWPTSTSYSSTFITALNTLQNVGNFSSISSMAQ